VKNDAFVFEFAFLIHQKYNMWMNGSLDGEQETHTFASLLPLIRRSIQTSYISSQNKASSTTRHLVGKQIESNSLCALSLRIILHSFSIRVQSRQFSFLCVFRFVFKKILSSGKKKTSNEFLYTIYRFVCRHSRT